jgi:hypothetical protein
MDESGGLDPERFAMPFAAYERVVQIYPTEGV